MTDVEVSPSFQQNGTSNNTNSHHQQQATTTIEEVDFDGDNSTARLFERPRIQVLADEREHVQKKPFTKWINSHLLRVPQTQRGDSDLYVNLGDGRNLIKLLEILSDERLPRPTRGKMRIHCVENVDKALLFL
jgi:spectrin beta